MTGSLLAHGTIELGGWLFARIALVDSFCDDEAQLRLLKSIKVQKNKKSMQKGTFLGIYKV
jgi:hypothetical protein